MVSILDSAAARNQTLLLATDPDSGLSALSRRAHFWAMDDFGPEVQRRK